MTARGAASSLPGVEQRGRVRARAWAVRARRWSDNARVMLRLLGGDRHDLWHFFFAPNPRSSAAGRLAARVRRVRDRADGVQRAGRPTPTSQRVLFCDRTVVLSRYTERRMLAAGISRARAALHSARGHAARSADARRTPRARASELGLPRDRALIVYPGDLEFSGAAERVLRAHAELRRTRDVVLVMACRAKTAARARARGAPARAGAHARASRTAWCGSARPRASTRCSACADVVALPAENLYAKMDLPLVLIEAMLLGAPVIVAQRHAGRGAGRRRCRVAVAADVDATAAALLAACSTMTPSARRSAQRARARGADALSSERTWPCAYEAFYDELLR